MGVTQLRDDQMKGEVQGPSSATDTSLAQFDGTSGKLVKDGLLKAAASGGTTTVQPVSGILALTSSGTTSVTGGTGLSLSAGAGASINANSYKLSSVADPTSDQDAATKNYVDTHVVGVSQGGTNADNIVDAKANLQAAGLNDVQALTHKDLTDSSNTFPTFNQNTTGSAATLTTGRTFQTNLASTTAVSFNGSANNSHGVTGTLPVANGGSGRATATTAYGLIAAGTTATGVQQTISPGTSGMFLKSAGTSALASFASIAESDVTNLTTDLAGKVATTTTVNGHALSSNVTVTATDLSLGNVDNTSDATKNSATATLTNKTIDASSNTISNVSNLSVSRQSDTTNATVGSTRIETGTGMIMGSGTTDISETVTFKTAFNSAPVVVAQFMGYEISSTYAPSSAASDWGGMTFSAQVPTTTGFTARGRRNDGASTGSTTAYYYTWIAIGA